MILFTNSTRETFRFPWQYKVFHSFLPDLFCEMLYSLPDLFQVNVVKSAILTPAKISLLFYYPKSQFLFIKLSQSQAFVLPEKAL
jgi:hypothetical protein